MRLRKRESKSANETMSIPLVRYVPLPTGLNPNHSVDATVRLAVECGGAAKAKIEFSLCVGRHRVPFLLLFA